MKKNVMMRIASILLVCVLATTCGISGTFAKYVTKAESEDNARVAKWGVTITGATDMFLEEYDKDLALSDKTVVSADDETINDLVAPGTEGTLTKFDISGEPEVAVRVTYVVDTFELTGWTADGDEYCPIIFKVVNHGVAKLLYIGGTDINGVDITNVAELKAAVSAAIVACKADYEAGANLADAEDDLVVSWMWQFDHLAAGFLGADGQNDEDDTHLGNWKMNDPLNPPTINFKVTCFITQVD